MKSFGWLFLIVVAVFFCAGLHAQPRERTSEQTFFREDEAFQRPVTLPQPILDILRRDEGVKFCLEELKEVPFASWFEAAKVNLGQSATGFVVKNANTCMGAADTGRFWIFRKEGPRYQLVLDHNGFSLALLRSYSNGYRNIIITAATAAYFFTYKFQFSNGKYRRTKYVVEPVRPNRK